MRSPLKPKPLKAEESLESLAKSMASIAESLREWVNFEKSKGGRPTIRNITKATYDRTENQENEPEVPGFRRVTTPTYPGANKA